MTKIEIENVIPDKESSFKVAVYENAYFSSPLHSHPEYELVMIIEGDGLCFCGDYVGPMKPGDIMLFGKALPHFCLSDKRYYDPTCKEKCKSIYIQFREELLPLLHKQMPGFNNINHILNLAERGLYFSSADYPHVVDMIHALPHSKDFDKVILLYTALNQLEEIKNFRILASSTYKNLNISKETAFNITIDYINKHYQTDISLSQIAVHANMNKSSLCRYFKRISGKSIFDYINEYRISYACKLIANTDVRISTIAYDCGFNNISHFNTHFKIITGYTPTAYRQMFRTNT